MTKIMTASGNARDGQIENVVGKFRDALRKHCGEIPVDIMQEVLGTKNLGMELFAVVRKHAEMLNGFITHDVSVNRGRTPMQALEASGRRLYINDAVVATMPLGNGTKAKLFYFKPRPQAFDRNGWMSPTNLAAEYDYVGLQPAPRAQIDDNTANPEFADDHPNACQWVDVDGNYFYAAFCRWSVERSVGVYRSDGGWRGGWLFAGVRK